MNAMPRALRFLLWASAVTGVFLAFGWPVVISADPASEAFRAVATTTVIVFLVSLAGVVSWRAVVIARAAGRERG